MQKILTLGNVDLKHDIKTNIITIVYNGFTKSADFRAVNERALELIRLYQADKMLVDQRKLGAMSAEDIKWLTSDLYPRIYATLKKHIKMALVLPESAFGEMAFKKITTEFDRSLHHVSSSNKQNNDTQPNIFPTPEAAHSWLIKN